MDEFIEIVLEQMEIEGLTRSELSRRAGIGRAYLYGVLDGHHVPSMDWAEKVAAALNIEITFTVQK